MSFFPLTSHTGWKPVPLFRSRLDFLAFLHFAMQFSWFFTGLKVQHPERVFFLVPVLSLFSVLSFLGFN